MNKTILALLLIVAALTGAAGAAQAGGGNHFTAPDEWVPSAASHDSNGAVAATHGSALNLAASSIRSLAHKVRAALDPRIVEEHCLATAVYFEARSEPQQGQLAVAMVILNRTRAEHYPASICGVVYQGANRFNGCQFSFACDGKTDLPEPGCAWDAARVATSMALAGGLETTDEQLRIVSAALNYHADYVKPRWSKSLLRLTKIGRHIFYSQG